MNLNTFFLTFQLALFGFLGHELWGELRLTHDAIIGMKIELVDMNSKMVLHSEYDVQISDVRARITAVEVEIQKLKQGKIP